MRKKKPSDPYRQTPKEKKSVKEFNDMFGKAGLALADINGKPIPTQAMIEFVFKDWEKDGKSIYNKAQGLALSLGSLHSGSMFKGTILLSEEDKEYLKEALKKDIDAVFWVRLRKR